MSMELLDQYSLWIQESIPIVLTNKSGITRTVQLYITSDATTGKSFEEIGNLISVLRTAKYMSKKVTYLSAVNDYKRTINNSLLISEEFPACSTFNDMSGYACKLQPDNQFITNMFKEYVETNRSDIESWQENNMVSYELIIGLIMVFNVNAFLFIHLIYIQ